MLIINTAGLQIRQDKQKFSILNSQFSIKNACFSTKYN